MSSTTQVIVTCDVCGTKEGNITKVVYPVLFLTEQTEGRPTTPYISNEKLDLCDKCLEAAVRIKAVGAQGYNEYTFKE